MRPEQLPIEDKHFLGAPETDYRLLYQDLAWHLHAVIHFRRPSKNDQYIIREIAKYTGIDADLIEGMSRGRIKSFDHFAIAVSTSGACYIGSTKTNTDNGDQYRRRYGFRLAVKKSLEAMCRGGAVDFEIGIEPPSGDMLNTIIRVKLEQLGL
jgi:hypothetical protein